MALRRYQHKFLQPLEIDQERVASSQNTSITATNLTVTNSNVTTETIRKLSTNNFFNSATPDYTPSVEALAIIGDPTVSQGAIAHIRNNNVSINDANVFGGLKFSSSPGADFVIGKSTQFGSGYLQVRRENGTVLMTMDGAGGLNVGSNSTLIVDTSNTRILVGAPSTSATYTKALFGTGNNNVNDGIIVSNTANAATPGLTISNWTGVTGTNGPRIYFDHSGVGTWHIGANNSSNQFDICSSWNTPLVNINSSGNFTVNSGNLVIGTSGKGIDFSATADGGTGITELFDDYEAGAWTPTVNKTGSSPSVSYTTRNGTYTKVGRLVTAFFDMVTSSVSGGTGTCIISGLPYVVKNTMGGYSVINWRDCSLIPAGAANTQLKGYAEQNNSYIVIQLDNSGASGFANAINVGTYNSSGRMTGYITYEV